MHPVTGPVHLNPVLTGMRPYPFLALDEALTELARHDARKVKLIELRFFAGLSEAEAASCLKISPATAARDWAFAKAWLYRRLKETE